MINTKETIKNAINEIKYDKDYLLNHDDINNNHLENSNVNGLTIVLILNRIGFKKINHHVNYDNSINCIMLSNKDYSQNGVSNPSTWLELFKEFGIN